MNVWKGTVINSIIDKFKDLTKTVLQSTVETTSGNNRTCQLMFAVGLEVRPGKDCEYVVIPFGKSDGNLVAIGGYNPNITPDVLDGEARLFSTTADGKTLQAYIKCLNTGILNVNGKNDNAVRYNELKTAFDQLKSDFDNHVQTSASAGFSLLDSLGQPVTGSCGKPTIPSSADLTSAKIDEITFPAVGE